MEAAQHWLRIEWQNGARLAYVRAFALEQEWITLATKVALILELPLRRVKVIH